MAVAILSHPPPPRHGRAKTRPSSLPGANTVPPKLDCRVKPGNDDLDNTSIAAGKNQYAIS